jgi:E3 ubiquitin-protein ligase EDD1
MRAHNSEHRDSLPVLDVTALRHVAFVLDAIIFYMRSSNETDCDRNDSNAWDDQDDNENDDVDDEFTSSIVMETESIDDNDMIRPSLGKRHSFFQRSESTLCLGCPAPDPFHTPMAEALPLAEQPQLLQPNARREELFGMPKQAITVPAVTEQTASSTLELPPIKLGLSAQSKDILSNNVSNSTVVISVTPSTAEIQPEISEEVKRKEILKRPHSPQPGTSKTFVENYDTDDSGDDEPQDLSQQTMASNKMDIDDTSSSSQKMEKHLYDDSDDSDEDSSSMRSPAAKKHRPLDPEETVNLPPGTEGFSISPTSRDSKNQEEIDPSVRPPIIVVTRRTVADAIETATANVLSKNKKTTLSECVAPETPLNFLPNNFMYEGKGEQNEGGSKSSVIVRVGQATVSIKKYLNYQRDKFDS